MKLAFLGSILLQLATSSRGEYIDMGGQYGQLTIEQENDAVNVCLSHPFKFTAQDGISDADIACPYEGCQFVVKDKDNCKDPIAQYTICALVAPIEDNHRHCEVVKISKDQMIQAINLGSGIRSFGISIKQKTWPDDTVGEWYFHPFTNPVQS